jgi:hypothetical protein
MYGPLRLSPARARKKDFVGVGAVSPFKSGAASCAKPAAVPHKQNSAANIAVRKNTIKVMILSGCVNTRKDTSFWVIRGSAGHPWERKE